MAEPDPGNKKIDQLRETLHDVKDTSNGMTTNFGVKISNTDDSLKVGDRGPIIMQDFHFREKLTHFDHERIPERVVHARGSGAFGYFQVYKSCSDVTKAGFLCDPSRKTPVFVRFSTVLGFRGSSDTVRDVRGFATKFYTEEGNFDLVGNNIPVFFVQDAIKFPDIVHAGKPEPDNEIPQAQTAHDNFWDFMGLQPETAHMTLWALSDRAIPRSYRMMQGFGVNTFVLVNDKNERRFVKFHWKPLLGVHSLAWDEAQKIAGQDPDYHRRDLWEAIMLGNGPEYELGLQIVEEKDEHSFDFDLLDDTKVIPEELVPVRWVGKMTLNRNPAEFFPVTEQVAFCIQNLVPGIDLSDDPMLQGRAFSYLDTQLIRLGGPNFNDIPINRPICPVFNNQRDGYHRNPICPHRFNYFPNRSGVPAPVPGEKGGYVHYQAFLQGMKERMRAPKFNDHYSQATLFWNSLSAVEKEHLIAAAHFELGKCDDVGVRQRMVSVYNHVDHDLAKLVAAGIGVDLPAAPAVENHGKASPNLSQEHPDKTPKNSIATRRIAFLVADGFDAVQLGEYRAAMKAGGAVTFIVGPMRGPIKSASGTVSVDADYSFWTCKSTLFDAIAIVGGAHVATLAKIGEAIMFPVEAFKHFKPILAVGEAVDLLRTNCGFISFGIELAGDPTSADVVSMLGVVTTYQHKSGAARAASAAVSGAVSGAAVGAGAGLVAAVAAPVLGAVGAAVGAVSGAVASALSGHGEAAVKFGEAIAAHRHWMRDVKRVPA